MTSFEVLGLSLHGLLALRWTRAAAEACGHDRAQLPEAGVRGWNRSRRQKLARKLAQTGANAGAEAGALLRSRLAHDCERGWRMALGSAALVTHREAEHLPSDHE